MTQHHLAIRRQGLLNAMSQWSDREPEITTGPLAQTDCTGREILMDTDSGDEGNRSISSRRPVHAAA